MTSFIGKKTDGSPIKFNFQLENGLPLKAIIEPEYVEKSNEEETKYALFATLTAQEIKDTNNVKILDAHFLSHEIWLDCENFYIVFTDLSDIIINKVKENNLGIYFLDQKENIIAVQYLK